MWNAQTDIDWSVGGQIDHARDPDNPLNSLGRTDEGPFGKLNAEERATDGKGKSHLVWDVDGWAVFAQDPAGFWAQLPACRERWLASLEVGDS